MAKNANPNGRFNLKNWLQIPIGVAIALIGALFIVFFDEVKYLGLVVGAAVISISIALLTLTLLGKRSGAAFALKIILVVTILATGVTAIVFMNQVPAIVCIILSGVVAVDCSVKAALNAKNSRYPFAGRIVMMVLSALTAIGAFLMIRYTPSETEGEAIGIASIIVGAIVILDSICNITAGILNLIIKNRASEKPEPISINGETPKEYLVDGEVDSFGTIYSNAVEEAYKEAEEAEDSYSEESEEDLEADFEEEPESEADETEPEDADEATEELAQEAPCEDAVPDEEETEDESLESKESDDALIDSVDSEDLENSADVSEEFENDAEFSSEGDETDSEISSEDDEKDAEDEEKKENNA